MSPTQQKPAPLAVTGAFEELRREFGEWMEACEATASTKDKIEKLTPHEQAVTEELLTGLAGRRDRIIELLARIGAEEQMERTLAKHHEERARRFRRMGEWVKFSIRMVMALRGWQRVEGRSSVLKLETNPPSVAILNVNAVPDEYCRPAEKVPDKERIKAALLMGEEVAGCVLVTDRKRLDVS